METNRDKNIKILENGRDDYRGFIREYKDGKTTTDNGYNPMRQEDYTVGYSVGFNVKEGESVTSHLYGKLKEGQTLTKNEKIAFYENVDIFNPEPVLSQGESFDFSKVLYSYESVSLHTLDQKISKEEINIFKERVVYVKMDIDIELIDRMENEKGAKAKKARLK